MDETTTGKKVEIEDSQGSSKNLPQVLLKIKKNVLLGSEITRNSHHLRLYKGYLSNYKWLEINPY